MAKKYWLMLGALVILLIAGGAWYYYSSSSAVDELHPAPANGDKVEADDHVMGDPNAPVTLVEYFAQACSACAHFDNTAFPQLKAKYIDTGKVRYVMRLYPIFPLDGPSYKLDECVPPENFFQAVDLLFRTQPNWDTAEYPHADPQGLMRAAPILGLSDQQASACMNSHAKDAHMNQVAKSGGARYVVKATPTFVIDFKKRDFANNSWAEVQAALDEELKAKGQ